MKEVLDKIEEYAELLREGTIFVYPTDTVYGVGGNAYLKEVCERVYSIKERAREKPLSVIAPSYEWILEYFEIDKSTLRLYLPGPYTLLLRKKDANFLKYTSFTDVVGVRIPDHEITLLVHKADVPLITTSANISNEPPAKSFEELDERITSRADIVIKGKCYLGRASTVIDPYTQKVYR